MNQHLLSAGLTETPAIVADVLTFMPGFIHHMHRHPYADMVVVPLSGTIRFLGDPSDPMGYGPGPASRRPAAELA